jgi:hypothetical protein
MADEDVSTSAAQRTFTSEPYAPQFLDEAGKTAEELKSGAKTSAAAQLQRLQDYIQHLYQVRNLAQMAAKGGAARGAGNSQNPLAAYKGMTELARQAGIPIDAEIAKTLQGSNNIENTMNQLIGQAGNLQAQLASISKSGGSAYGNLSVGGQLRSGQGNGGGQGNGQGGGGYKNIRGETGDVSVMEGGRSPVDPKFGQKNISDAVQTGLSGIDNLRRIVESGGKLNPRQQQIWDADALKNHNLVQNIVNSKSSFGTTDPNKPSLTPEFDITSGTNTTPQSMFDSVENGEGSLQLSPYKNFNQQSDIYLQNQGGGGEGGGTSASIEDPNHPVWDSLPGIKNFGNLDDVNLGYSSDPYSWSSGSSYDSNAFNVQPRPKEAGYEGVGKLATAKSPWEAGGDFSSWFDPFMGNETAGL